MDEADANENRRSLEAHPGYLGYATSDGQGFIVAMHADWPVYPCPPGDGHALFDLAQFPEGVEFVPVDDIDQCLLFEARGYGERNLQERDRYYVACWHEDLRLLAEAGLITGMRFVTEREREIERREELRRSFTGAGWVGPGDPLESLKVTVDGQETPISLPPLDTYDGDDEDDDYVAARDWPLILPGDKTVVTAAGWKQVNDALADAEIPFPADLNYIPDLINIGLYDTAVRDIAVTLESRLRDTLGGETYGQRLAEDFIRDLLDRAEQPTSLAKVYRLRLRTFFKFIRNDYAHHRVELSRPQALALIAHVTMILNDIQELLEDR
ncbi:hypothetical protein [Streptomyces sp. DH7]|uniref:hypothetical protein n=1 Tax=Streptomyces sp. DH7 TaxID=2857006 RepID=UPI001E5FE416|nr:hypothetical protein [Streptomyces sp. DH7]